MEDTVTANITSPSSNSSSRLRSNQRKNGDSVRLLRKGRRRINGPNPKPNRSSILLRNEPPFAALPFLLILLLPLLLVVVVRSCGGLNHYYYCSCNAFSYYDSAVSSSSLSSHPPLGIRFRDTQRPSPIPSASVVSHHPRQRTRLHHQQQILPQPPAPHDDRGRRRRITGGSRLFLRPPMMPLSTPSLSSSSSFSSSYKGYPDEFDFDSTNNHPQNPQDNNNNPTEHESEQRNVDDHYDHARGAMAAGGGSAAADSEPTTMKWWEQAIRRASSSGSEAAVQPPSPSFFPPQRSRPPVVQKTITTTSSSAAATTTTTAVAGFGKLFAGMPSMSEILNGKDNHHNDDDDDDTREQEEGDRDHHEDDENGNPPPPSLIAASISKRKSILRRRYYDSRVRRQQNDNKAHENDDNHNNEAAMMDKNNDDDASWFDEEKRHIEAHYQDMLNSVLDQLDQQRRQHQQFSTKTNTNAGDDDDATKSLGHNTHTNIPENSEALVRSVLKEEMERELRETRNVRAKERLDAYTAAALLEEAAAFVVHNDDDKIDENALLLQNLIDESEKEYAQQESIRSDVEAFLQYEQEAFRRAAAQEINHLPNRSEKLNLPAPGADLDQWALQQLQGMMAKRRRIHDEDDKDDGSSNDSSNVHVLDILEDNVNDLQQRLHKKESRQGKSPMFQPSSMKEWQMYRSIATRLAANDDDVSSDNNEHLDTDDNNNNNNEARILAQLESWKEYVKKEAQLRDQSGLSRGPKLPFEWHESSSPRPADSSATTPTIADDPHHQSKSRRSQVEVRKEINRMSIQALESLMNTATDASRRENLRREVEFLKSTLESRDYLDVEADELMDSSSTASVPVDLSNVFSRTSDNDQTKFKQMPQSAATVQRPSNTQLLDDDNDQEKRFEPLSKSSIRQVGESEASTPKARPPDTPFFTERRNEPEPDDESMRDSKLGSMEEQKLNAMFRRAGVRSKEEQDVIRFQWEAFQRAEQETRAESGLSTTNDSSGDDPLLQTGVAKLKYNLSDVMRDDGDFDASKILATIGPRPQRSKRRSLNVDDESGESTLKSSVDSSDVVRDSLFRAVSAVGGGRYKDDPDARSRQQASFEEFLEKEEEMRLSLEDLNVEAPIHESANATFDDQAYAEQVLSKLGPRPEPKRSKIIDERILSDTGGVLDQEDDDEKDKDDDNDDDDDLKKGRSDELLWGGVMPEWLQNERTQDRTRLSEKNRGGFLGSDIDDVFDDDYYDRNMRQLHEYEQRRSGGRRQMGIDISDVFGRRAYETDDYADYKFDDNSFRGGANSGWGASSFAARKQELLQYTELDLVELHRLMDHKDSIYTTGISQYLPRINKPFKEFGAIFRFESVLVDTTGLQFQAWSKVASDFAFRSLTIEDVRRAAVIRPESAVREVFFWTDDVLECRRAAEAHRIALRKGFEDWKQSVGIAADTTPSPPPPMSTVMLHTQEKNVTAPNASSFKNASGGMVGSSDAAWAAVAKAFGKPIPSAEEGWLAASLSVEEAIVAFRWTDDPVSVLEMAKAYREFLKSGTLTTLNQATSEPEASEAPYSSPMVTSDALDDNTVAELQYFAWKKVAERFQYDSPDPEAALAAFVVNDPEMVIREGFGWTDDPESVQAAAKYFKTCFEEHLLNRMGGKIAIVDASSSQLPETPLGPTPDEMFNVKLEAWLVAARAYGLPLPTVEMTKLAQDADAHDSIRRIFKWTDDAALIEKVAETYQLRYNDLMRQLMRQNGMMFQPSDKTTVKSQPPSSSHATESASSQRGPTDDDIFRLALDSWTAVASINNYPIPDHDQVMFAMTVGPEEGIRSGFQWAEDHDQVATILEAYKAEVGTRRQRWSSIEESSKGSSRTSQGSSSLSSAGERAASFNVPPVAVSPDVKQWIQSLREVEMPCAVVSFLERDQVHTLLQYAGLADWFPTDVCVSASDGYRRKSQQLLGAALRLERRPDHCVVLDASPGASDAAHENRMKSISVIGTYPRYELIQADATVASLDELTAMNVRRLFGERVYDYNGENNEQQPLQLETQATLPGGSGNQRQPKTRTRFWDDGGDK